MFYKCGPIDHCTHLPGPVAQSSCDVENNAACTEIMDLAYHRIIGIDLLNKDPDTVPEESPLITFDKKSAICMANHIPYAL